MLCQRINLQAAIAIQGLHPWLLIRGNLGSKMGLIRKRAKNKFCELEFKNQ